VVCSAGVMLAPVVPLSDAARSGFVAEAGGPGIAKVHSDTGHGRARVPSEARN